MSSNLTLTGGFKELLLKKLSYAVTCSVLSHLAIVLLYVVIINFTCQVFEWGRLSFNTLTSISTWLHLIPFCTIIFVEVIICAKDYVVKERNNFSRFDKYISVLSLHTFLLGLLQVMVGGLAVWLYLALTDGPYQDLFVSCREHQNCLVDGTFYLLVSGLWSGFYFFMVIYQTNRKLIFPVIQQRKFLQFKAKFLPLLKQSLKAAFYPTIYYFVLYYLFGSFLRSLFVNIFKLQSKVEDFSVWVYFYTWIFTFLYIFNMKLMQFLFELFLTEPVEHAIIPINENDISVSEAILLSNTPIIQHLACLDLYLLSTGSPQRRQALYTLSQPGSHPHTWNRLIENALKLLKEFTDQLNNAMDLLDISSEDETQKILKSKFLRNKCVLPDCPPKAQMIENMRNLSSMQPTDNLNCPPFQQKRILEVVVEILSDKLRILCANIWNLSMMKYFFEESGEAHIQSCLKNGQVIAWTTQGLTNVAVASYHEDPYGVVQKDLPLLISSLVHLKQSVARLSKLPELSKKGPGFDDFSFKMKNHVNSAVSRSLHNLCRTFGKYCRDFQLSNDCISQLQSYL